MLTVGFINDLSVSSNILKRVVIIASCSLIVFYSAL